MTKNLYVLAWFLVAASLLVSALNDTLTPASLLAYSLVVLGLVYLLALWSVIINTRELKNR